MKYILTLIALLIGPSGISVKGSSDKHEVPLYITDFLHHVNVDLTTIVEPANLQSIVNQRINSLGCQKLLDVAKKARDEYIGCPYFRIETGEIVSVSHEYFLTDRLKIVTIGFVKDAKGQLVYAAFSVSTVE